MRSTIPVIGMILVCGAAPAAAQALGEVALREAARRKEIVAPAKVITEIDLTADFPVTSPTEVPGWPEVETTDPDVPRTIVAPALMSSGNAPEIPITALGVGEVFLELTVAEDGRVSKVTPLRDTPPFTASLSTAVRGWSFKPAEAVETPKAGAPIDEKTRKPSASKVLVVGVFRPPALYAGTLGTPPADVAAPSQDVPAPRSAVTMPDVPPGALFDGVVVTEVRLGDGGAITGLKVVRSSPPFDEAAKVATSALAFRPARAGGREVPSAVYVVMGFRQPITQ